MLIHFIETDSKLLLTWVGSTIMVILQMVGFNIQEYELWKIIALDALTAISLIIAIGYTIFRWRRLIKKGREEEAKK